MKKECVCIIPTWIVCSISLFALFMHAGDKKEGGWGVGKHTSDCVPKVTLLYTLLNLTGVDVALGGERAPLESEKRKVGQRAL